MTNAEQLGNKCKSASLLYYIQRLTINQTVHMASKREEIDLIIDKYNDVCWILVSDPNFIVILTEIREWLKTSKN